MRRQQGAMDRAHIFKARPISPAECHEYLAQSPVSDWRAVLFKCPRRGDRSARGADGASGRLRPSASPGRRCPSACPGRRRGAASGRGRACRCGLCCASWRSARGRLPVALQRRRGLGMVASGCWLVACRMGLACGMGLACRMAWLRLPQMVKPRLSRAVC
jgi:hypothetical protein